MTAIQEAPTTSGRHAGVPAEVDREIERLVEVGVPSGLPAGLGDNQGTQVRGAHRAEIADVADEIDEALEPHTAAVVAPAASPGGSHLPWRLLLTGILAILVVLALAFVALDSLAAGWTSGGGVA